MRSIAIGLLIYFTVLRYAVRITAEYYLGSSIANAFTYPYPILFGFFCLLVSYNYLVRPLNQMNRVMNRFKSGHFEERISIKRKDEIGEIAETFNELANRVQFLILTERNMTANLGHEIRTPLTRMMLHLNNVKERVDIDESVLLLENEIRNLSSIASKLLKLAQLERGEFKPQFERVNLYELVQNVARKMKGLARNQSCSIEVQAFGNSVCQTDRDLMEMVLDNILDNAIHYSGDSSLIQVVLNSDLKPEGFVEISVRDQGPGVPESDIERIFMQFERVDASRDRKTGGSGLGLAICKSIVTSLGGSIEARNLNPGFEIRIRLRIKP